MITFEEAIEMNILSKQGNSIRNIAKDMQRARNTVRFKITSCITRAEPNRANLASS